MSKTDKTKAAEAFLKTLENPEVTKDLMMDRIDIQLLHVINDYAELISKAKSSVDGKDLTTCSMIIGFLLAGYVQRADLQDTLKLSLGE